MYQGLVVDNFSGAVAKFSGAPSGYSLVHYSGGGYFGSTYFTEGGRLQLSNDITDTLNAYGWNIFNLGLSAGLYTVAINPSYLNLEFDIYLKCGDSPVNIANEIINIIQNSGYLNNVTITGTVIDYGCVSTNPPNGDALEAACKKQGGTWTGTASGGHWTTDGTCTPANSNTSGGGDIQSLLNSLMNNPQQTPTTFNPAHSSLASSLFTTDGKLSGVAMLTIGIVAIGVVVAATSGSR